MILFQLLVCIAGGFGLWQALAQSVPYAREYPKSKEDVDKALKELGAFSGQKLPIVDGFVATGDRRLDRYERAFYQFSIDVLPGSAERHRCASDGKNYGLVCRSRALEIGLSDTSFQWTPRT